MAVRKRAVEAGIFNRAELELLAWVFDGSKYDGQTTEQREALASRMIANFMAGIVDEHELVSLSRLPLGDTGLTSRRPARRSNSRLLRSDEGRCGNCRRQTE